MTDPYAPRITKPKPDPWTVEQGPSVSIGEGGAVTPITAPLPASVPAPTPQQTQSSVNVPSNVQSQVGNLFQTPPASPVQGAYQDALLGFLNTAQQPVGQIQGSALQPVSEAYRAGQQRSTERGRSAMAERAAQTGTLGAGGFDTGVQKLYNQEGRNVSEFDARLMQGEVDARRQQLIQGLTLAQQTGNSEAERTLRAQLALLNSATDESQFGRELGFRESALTQQGRLGSGQLILQLLGLLTGNQYNYDVLGSNNAFRLSDINQNALQLALGR